MNEKLPKPVHDALRTQAQPTEHPSADVLSAYMEQSLPESERNSLISHLAQCRDCRDIVFLASGATEDSVAQQEVLTAAKSGRRWLPRLVWVGTAAAGLLLVGGYFVRDRMSSQRPETMVASNQEAMRSESQPAQPQTQPQTPPLQSASNAVTAASRPSATPHANAPAKKMASAAAVASAPPPQAAKAAFAQAEVSAPLPQADMRASQAESAKAAPSTIEVGALPSLAAPAPRSNAFAPSAASESAPPGEGAALGGSVERSMHFSANYAAWRVNGAGAVEHQTPDGWTRALADQPAVFRTVYARGDSVWAGGDGGMLFHSSDRGAQWKKVVLSAESVPETATIATIHFSSPQNGVVITSAGTIYATADGGATWTRR
jgi:hypothetical protein